MRAASEQSVHVYLGEDILLKLFINAGQLPSIITFEIQLETAEKNEK